MNESCLLWLLHSGSMENEVLKSLEINLTSQDPIIPYGGFISWMLKTDQSLPESEKIRKTDLNSGSIFKTNSFFKMICPKDSHLEILIRSMTRVHRISQTLKIWRHIIETLLAESKSINIENKWKFRPSKAFARNRQQFTANRRRNTLKGSKVNEKQISISRQKYFANRSFFNNMTMPPLYKIDVSHDVSVLWMIVGKKTAQTESRQKINKTSYFF